VNLFKNRPTIIKRAETEIMRKNPLIFCITLLIIITIIYPKQPTEDVYYNIPPGTSVIKIQNDLFKLGLEPFYGMFLLRLTMSNQLKNIKAGEYHFPTGISSVDLTQKLTNGYSITYKIFIPEGLTTYQIVQIINKAPFLKGRISEIPNEGSIFPTTISYTKGLDREKIITRLKKIMSEKLQTNFQL